MAAKKKRKNILVRLFAGAFLLYTVVSMVQLSLQIHYKKEEKKLLETQIAAKLEDNEALASLLDSVSSEEYIEKIARDRLGYVSAGERVFVPVTGDSEE